MMTAPLAPTARRLLALAAAAALLAAPPWSPAFADDAPPRAPAAPAAAEPVPAALPVGGIRKTEPKSGLVFVSIPGGQFQYQGARPTAIKPFFLGEGPVTIEAWTWCFKAGSCSAPGAGERCNWKSDRAGHPINCVNHKQATSFCKWIGGRLPTEEEREFVATGGERRRYPWGTAEPAARACWDGEGSDLGQGRRRGTCYVGAYKDGDSKWGLHDLAGNVWEWTSSDYSEDHTNKVVRGASYRANDESELFSVRRRSRDPNNRTDYIGLRCALDPK